MVFPQAPGARISGSDATSRWFGDLGGTIHCLDAATGAHVWKHETNEAIWGSLLLAGDWLYVGNLEGTMTALRAGRRKQLVAQIEMHAPLYSPPAMIGECALSGHREPVVPHRGKALILTRVQLSNYPKDGLCNR